MVVMSKYMNIPERIVKMSENYQHNATNSTGDKAVRERADAKEQAVRDMIQGWLPTIEVLRKKRSILATTGSL